MSRTRVGGGLGSEFGSAPGGTGPIIAGAAVAFGALITARTAAAATLAVLVLAGCGGGGGESSTAAALPAGCTRAPAPAANAVHLSRPTTTLRGPATATVETSCGSFMIALDTARAPRTASSFAYLARHGVYDDTPFHRIVPGFVIQGGDPAGTGEGGPGYSVKEAPPSSLKYTEGIVAMAKTGAEPAGTSGSQFFIVTGPDAEQLTPAYALLGKVTKGMDVATRIGGIQAGPDGAPAAQVVMKTVTVKEG